MTEKKEEIEIWDAFASSLFLLPPSPVPATLLLFDKGARAKENNKLPPMWSPVLSFPCAAAVGRPHSSKTWVWVFLPLVEIDSRQPQINRILVTSDPQACPHPDGHRLTEWLTPTSKYFVLVLFRQGNVLCLCCGYWDLLELPTFILADK